LLIFDLKKIPRFRGIFLSDCDAFIEINILYRIQHFHTIGKRSLESLASEDQSHTASAFIYYGSSYCFHEIAFALALTTTVDQTYTAIEAAQYLITGEVDWVI